MAAPTGPIQHGNGYLYTWVLTTADPTGDAVEISGAADKCVQMEGTWGTATAKLQGSNTNADAKFLSLTDPQGNEFSKTADAIEQVLEGPRFIRPKLTAVGAGATVNVTMFCRSTMR